MWLPYILRAQKREKQDLSVVKAQPLITVLIVCVFLFERYNGSAGETDKPREYLVERREKKAW